MEETRRLLGIPDAVADKDVGLVKRIQDLVEFAEYAAAKGNTDKEANRNRAVAARQLVRYLGYPAKKVGEVAAYLVGRQL